MTWAQRIGFAVFSFVLFAPGVLFVLLALKDTLGGEILGAIGWLIPGVVCIIPGLLGLRNVLRF